MKIAIHKTDLNGYGGIGKFTDELLSFLNKDHELLVLDKCSFFRKRFLNYHTVNADLFFYPKNYGTFRLFKRAEVLVVCHDVMKFRYPILQSGKTSFLRTFRRKTKLLTLKFSDTIVFPSKFSLDELDKIMKTKANKYVIPLGVDVNKYKPAKKSKKIFIASGNEVHKNISSVIGDFMRWKGFTRYLLGLDIVTMYRKNGWLLVISANKLTEEELIKAYSTSTVVIVPSHYEGFGLPYLEGLASGCYVMSKNLPSFQEWFKGQYIPINFDLLDDLYKKGVNESGVKLAQNYTWEKVYEGYKIILTNLQFERNKNEKR